MKKIFIFMAFTLPFGDLMAQTTIANGNFEAWGNTTPGLSSEPTGWYSNQSGSTIASLGPQTCFKDITVYHGGAASVRVESKLYLGSVVNGNVTTGVVNAPNTTKSNGYIGTINYTTSTDVRRMAFVGRPDSIVGWYQYTQGASSEQGKIRGILHTADYFDPETPTTYHANPTANKVGDATFLTPFANVSSWTRFSVPFTYAATTAPAYIMINVTSSADQATTIAGSKLWLDDLAVVYNSTTAIKPVSLSADNVDVYSYGTTVYVNFLNGTEELSQIKLYDLTGRNVLCENMKSDGSHSFDLSGLSSGIYVYELNNTGFCKKGKLFIQ